MQKSKAIIFDCDDTLVQTSKTVYQVMKELGKKNYGLNITDAMIKSRWGLPMQEFFEKLYDTHEPWEVLKSNYLQLRSNYQNIAYDDALEFVTQLNGAITIGVVSSADTDIVERDLVTCGYDLEKFFAIMGADKTFAHKPDPEVFTPLLQRLKVLGIVPQEVVYIGDSLDDYFASIGAGIRFVGLYDRTTSKQDFDREGATTVGSFHVIHDLIY